MMESLAERRMLKEDEAAMSVEMDSEEDEDDEDDGDEDEEDEEDDDEEEDEEDEVHPLTSVEVSMLNYLLGHNGGTAHRGRQTDVFHLRGADVRTAGPSGL